MTRKTVSKYFTIDVVGHRLTKNVWRIDGALRFLEGLDVAARENLLGKGRLALVNAIVREGVRGRAHGATAVQVHMDVDGQVSDFDLADVPVATAIPV